MAETEEAGAGEVADEQAVDEQAVNEKEKARITELQGWHREKEAASRHNRNLLQYAAAIAVVLGIDWYRFRSAKNELAVRTEPQHGGKQDGHPRIYMLQRIERQTAQLGRRRISLK